MKQASAEERVIVNSYIPGIVAAVARNDPNGAWSLYLMLLEALQARSGREPCDSMPLLFWASCGFGASLLKTLGNHEALPDQYVAQVVARQLEMDQEV